MKQYTDLLSSVPGVSAWVVRVMRNTEMQRYLIGDRPEAGRKVDETQVNIVVLSNHDGGQGRSEFTLFGQRPTLERSRVEEAVFMARLQSNPPYELPAPSDMPVVETHDAELDGDMRRAVDRLEERIFAAVAREPGVRLSAAELFVTRGASEIRTSAGTAAESAGTFIFLEFVLLAGSGAEEVESFGQYSARRVVDLDLETIVARHARRARDTQQSSLPATRRGPVVLSEGCFTPLFGPLQFATGGGALYRKMSRLEVGESVFGDRAVVGDPLTLHSDPTLPFATGSRPFDGDGLALHRVPVIEQGQFTTVVASKRFADYLSVPATGGWSNTVLAPGRTPSAALLDAGDGPVLHVVEFSWLNPSGVTGDFSTEIRLGYEIGPNGTRVVKGGSLSGNVYDAFAAVRLASEVELSANYYGPTALRFDSLQITGA